MGILAKRTNGFYVIAYAHSTRAVDEFRKIQSLILQNYYMDVMLIG